METRAPGTATDSNPWDDVSTVLARARAARQTADGELAYELYARATELDPHSAEAWRGRSETSTLPDDALLSGAYASALDHDDPSLLSRLDQAVESRAQGAKYADVGSLTLVGQKLAGVGFTKEALKLLRRSVELDDRQVEALVWLAAVCDDPHEAQAALKQALAVDPGDPRAKAGLEAVSRELERMPAEATKSTAPALTAPPAEDAAAVLIRDGQEALNSGDKTRAYSLFVMATEKSPHSEAAWLGRARAAEDNDEALTCLEQALAINPDNMQAREARTFYRVRKLREGVRKMPEPDSTDVRFSPNFAGGASFSETPSEQVRQRRTVLLVIMLVILVLALILLYIRMQQ